VKDILLRPVHEEQWPKLRLLFEAVKEEIERVEDVYLNSEQDVEDLARAVENCTSKFADEVGPGFRAVPVGSRLEVDIVAKTKEVAESRRIVASLVRGAQVGSPVRVRLRPMHTAREPPLDKTGKNLMRASCFERFAESFAGALETRDALLIQLWDALFLTQCEQWSALKVSNTTAADALELAWWFQLGGTIGKQPIFNGICVGALACAFLLLCRGAALFFLFAALCVDW